MTAPTSISLGGFVPLSTVDWPDQLVATVFTRGCPWDCLYCHNSHLLQGAAVEGEGEACAERGFERAPQPEGPQSWAEVLGFLRARSGLLDGVVFSGGEPVAQRGITEAVQQVREMGFAVGLHTSGSVTSRFEALLPHVDWVGFDYKAPTTCYERVTRVPGSGETALESLRALVRSGVAFEVRTTVHEELLDAAALAQVADELEREGVSRWAIQAYRPEGVRPGLLGAAGSIEELLPADIAERFDLTLR